MSRYPLSIWNSHHQGHSVFHEGHCLESPDQLVVYRISFILDLTSSFLIAPFTSSQCPLYHQNPNRLFPTPDTLGTLLNIPATPANISKTLSGHRPPNLCWGCPGLLSRGCTGGGDEAHLHSVRTFCYNYLGYRNGHTQYKTSKAKGVSEVQASL